MENFIIYAVGGLITFIAIGFIVFWVSLLGPWQRAFMHGAKVSLIEIVMARMRGNPVSLILEALFSLQQQEVSASFGDVERTFIKHRSAIITSADLVEYTQRDLQTAR